MKMATELYLEMPHQLLDQIELFSRRRNKQPIFYPLCQYTCRLGTRGWGLSPLQNPRPRAGYLWKVNADVWKSKCKNDIRLTDDIKRPLLLKVHSSVFLFFLKMFRNHTSWRRLLIWISWNVCKIDWYEVCWCPSKPSKPIPIFCWIVSYHCLSLFIIQKECIYMFKLSNLSNEYIFALICLLVIYIFPLIIQITCIMSKGHKYIYM